MNTKLLMAFVATLLTTAACANSPPTTGQQASVTGHKLVECTRVAPTGSRLKTHIECGDRGGYRNYKVRTWADIEKERQ